MNCSSLTGVRKLQSEPPQNGIQNSSYVKLSSCAVNETLGAIADDRTSCGDVERRTLWCVRYLFGRQNVPRRDTLLCDLYFGKARFGPLSTDAAIVIIFINSSSSSSNNNNERECLSHGVAATLERQEHFINESTLHRSTTTPPAAAE